MFTRRQFLSSLVMLAATPWARAAEPREAKIGFLVTTTAANFNERREAFLGGLTALGRREGAGLSIDWRYADDRPDRIAELAKALVSMKPAVLVSDSAATTVALRQATTEIPIVMASADDPVASRLVKSLEQPGGNVTGLTAGNPDEVLKAVEHLARLVPAGSSVAVLLDQNNAHYRKIRARVRYAALQAKLKFVFVDANNPAELPAAFAAIKEQRAAGAVVMSDAMFYDQRAAIVKLATSARIPVVYPDRAFVQAGGLMSHGPDLRANYQRVAHYVHKLLEGSRPNDLPVENPSKYELVINRRMAHAIKPPFPKDLLANAAALL